MAVLPSGSKVIPADKTNKAMSGKTEIKVNVEIQGNVIGNSEFADEVGETVAKVILVLDNIGGNMDLVVSANNNEEVMVFPFVPPGTEFEDPWEYEEFKGIKGTLQLMSWLS